MIRLTPDQYERLALALGQAFTLAELEQFLMFRLGRNLQWQAGGTDLRDVVYKLIGWAQRDRWLPELIQEAVAAKQTLALQQLANELRPVIISATVDHFNVTFVNNNLALVNRTLLRQSLKQLAVPALNSAQILIVNGPPLSGKSYSVELISYLFRALRSFNFVLVDLKKFPGEIRPIHIANDIVIQMKLDRGIIPELNEEQDSRWVYRFCSGLQAELTNAADKRWIVIDGFNHARLSPSVNDLVNELSERVHRNLPELRLVLLSYPNQLSPTLEQAAIRETIAPVDRQDLSKFFAQVYYENNKTYFPRDIADRIGEVLRAADPTSASYMEMLGAEVVKVAKQIAA